MRHYCVIFSLLTTIVCSSSSAFGDDIKNNKSFRCGSSIVRQGMIRAEVRDKCGEPTDVSTRRGLKYIGYSKKLINENDQEQVEQAIHEGTVIYVEIEEWFYNFGPSRLTYKLAFTDNHLDQIFTSGRGY